MHPLLIALVFSALGASGCLRFGYGERVDSGDTKSDGGASDAGTLSAGRSGSGAGGSGSGGSGAGGGSGVGGNAGVPSDGGSQEAGAGSSGDGGADEPDAGMIITPTDAGPDSGVLDGSTDAGEVDSGPVVISELCPEQPGVAFCDGFEDPEFTRWAYDVSSNGTLTRSTTYAHSGTTSLRATTGPPAHGTEARWATEALDKQKSGHAWLRFYNWVPGSVDVTQHFSVGVISENVAPYEGFELRILPSMVDINSSSGVFDGSMAFPRDRWVCVEMHVYIHPSAGVYEAYLDGTLAASSPPTDTEAPDGFTAAEVGIHYADPNQGPVEVYVDDVAVGRARIPCDD